MSIKLSVNLSFSNKFKKTDEDAQQKDQKKKSAAKQNPLLNTKTDPYVDDNEAYTQRISKADKYAYWMALLPNRGPRRPLPKGFQSWKQREIASLNQQANYHWFYIRSFNFFSSVNWDHRSINLFIIFLILVIFFMDGYAEQYAPTVAALNTGNQILAVFPFLIFICQLIPFLGMLYFIGNCNDLVHFKAIKEIGKWAFTSALTAQYIEYFYYRGIGHPERAGNCKTGHDPNPRPILSFLKYYLNFLRGRAHAKIQNHETESENENEESVTEEKEDQEDDNKSEDGNIEQNKIPLKSVLKKPKPIHNIHENDNKTQENEGTNIEGLKPKPVENNGNKSKRRPSSATAASESSRRKSSDIIGYADNGDPIFRPVIEYTDWKCIVCNKDNHQPTHSKVDSDIWFGEKGVHYKRTYAVIQARRDVPTCVKCGTYADYKPPLGSAHIFPYNPTPHKAFEGYPVPSTVQAGLKPDIYSRFLYALKGFFFGIKDNINSAPLKNDWRLEKFVNNRFPELPRYVLKPGECYQVGEIVECKQQKFAWARARVLVAHNNHSYDIRYDPGDELRFVEERAIRTIPEKRAYAFRVEMGLVVIALLSPLGLALGLVSGNIGLSMLGLLVVSTALLSIRLVMIAQYFINYFDAGLVPVLKLSAIYTLPLLFLMIASAIGVGSGASPSAWSGVAVLLILTKVSTLPYLYIYRPPYLVIGGSVFLLSSIGIVGMSMYASSPASVVYITLPIAPILIMTIWIKIIRTNLHNIWDVCLIIRPAKNTEFENPSVLGKAKDLIMEYIDP